VRGAFRSGISRPGRYRRDADCVLTPLRAAGGYQGRFRGTRHQSGDPQDARRQRQCGAGGSSPRAAQQGQSALAHRQPVQAGAGARLGAVVAHHSWRRRRDRVRLDPALQQRLRNAFGWHDYAYSRGKIAPDLASPAERAALPPQCWRLVWRNPANGRDALYLASHTYAIEGMELKEAQQLLGELMAAATAREHSYLHTWSKGDVVMWDNRATMHRGRPWPANEPRYMVRTTISAAAVDGLETMRAPPRQAAE